MLTAGTRGVFARLALLSAALWCCAPAERPVLAIALFESSVAAARLAVHDAAEAGSRPMFDTLIRYESGGEASQAIQLARDLVATRGLVGVVGHSNSASSLAAAQVYNDAHVVQLAPTSTAVLYSQAGPYSFRMVPPDDQQGKFLAETVQRQFPNGARVALLYVNDDYGRGLRASVLAALDTTGYALVLDISHVDTDVRPAVIEQATRAASEARPDVVLWLSRSGMLYQYLPPLREALGDTPIIAGDAVSTWPHHVHSDDRWAGVQHVDFVDLAADDSLRAFAARFEATYGTRASGADVLTYDAVRVLIAGIDDGATTGALLREYLTSLGRARPAFKALSGEIVFTERGDVARQHLLVTIPSQRGRP